MLAKIHVPAIAEVGLVAATTGAARGNGKEGWDSDSGASLQISHTQAGKTAYKKALAETTDECADGVILPAEGSRPLRWIWTSRYYDQASEDDSVAYVPGPSQNLLSTRKAGKQWCKPLVYYKTKTVLGFTGEESLVFNFYLRKGLFSAKGVRLTPNKGAALA